MIVYSLYDPFWSYYIFIHYFYNIDYLYIDRNILNFEYFFHWLTLWIIQFSITMSTKEELSLNKKEFEFAQNLKKLPDEQIISLMVGLRESGKIYVLRPLLDEYFSRDSSKLKEAIIEFITDIKDHHIVPILVDSIRNHYQNTSIAGLISACWQSRLDFSKDISLFIEILCNKEYQTALEAFTVIENSLENLDSSNRTSIISTIRSNRMNAPKETKALLDQMIVVIGKFVPDEDDQLT